MHSEKQQSDVPKKEQPAKDPAASPSNDSSVDRKRKLKAYGPMISVIGALILFFSWSIRNTLHQHYSQLKTSIQTAESTFRLYNTLHELRNSVNSLAMEVVQEKTGIHATRFRSGKTDDAEINQARREFDLARLSAHQLKELMDFAFKTLDLSNSLGDGASTHQDIVSLTTEIETLRDSVSTKEAAAEAENNIPIDQLTDKSFPAIYDYVDFWHNEAVHKMPEYFPRVVELSNSRLDEARETLAAAKRKSEFADKAAFYLYFLGSLLALGGQAIDKLIKVDA